MVKCFNHPDREAVENCAGCGKPLCKDCIYLGPDRLLYCPRCAPDEEEIGPERPPWADDDDDDGFFGF